MPGEGLEEIDRNEIDYDRIGHNRLTTTRFPRCGAEVTQVDALTFISRITADLAWPIGAIVLAVMFRKAVDDVLRRLTDLKWGRFAAKLARARIGISPPVVRDAPARVFPVAPPGPGERKLTRETIRDPENLTVRKSAQLPIAQIERSWKALNLEIRRKASAAGVEPARNLKQLISAMIAQGVLTPDFESNYSRLDVLHKANIEDKAVVREFRKISSALMEHLRQIEP